MSYQDSDETELNTELQALEEYVNQCDAEIREARPIIQGIRAVLANVDHDGSSLTGERRLALKNSLVTKSKGVRSA